MIGGGINSVLPFGIIINPTKDPTPESSGRERGRQLTRPNLQDLSSLVWKFELPL
jgi:hypothetical protein